jgi:signal transduction histidine kinase
VLGILLLLTTGATIAYYKNASAFADYSGQRWAPVVFLIGLCVSLLIFGMTHREATTRAALLRRTADLLQSQIENKALLKAEEESRVAAERASVAKDEFLAVVSHELKTPLNAIAGWTRILKTAGISDEDRENALKKIDKNLQMQISVVEELLSFSDVMSSGPKLAMRPLRICDVIEEAVNSVSVSAFQKGISLAVALDLDDCQINCDGDRLKLALANIIANAVKFTPPGGSVRISGRTSGEEAICIVEDDGLGIDPEFLPHVFEQYAQSEFAMTRNFSGLGLGLTIAKHIVQLHNGTIEAASAGSGAGSTFTVHLPVDQNSSAASVR